MAPLSLPRAPCRYASLYFCCCVEESDNELLALEVIHRYVELLDKYFGSVSVRLLLLHRLRLVSRHSRLASSHMAVSLAKLKKEPPSATG